ncbi:MAG: DUF4375 domain-containing protein [Chitinophagales bacterium]
MLLNLFGCKGKPTRDKAVTDTDTMSQQMAKSLEEFKNRPIHKRLTSEIFDGISDDNIEQAIMDNIWAKMDKDMSNDYEVVTHLSSPRQAIYIVWQVESEVNNGGFDQFYFNSSGRFANKAENAFKEIGSAKFANLMHRANKTYNANNETPLSDLDAEFYNLYKLENLNEIKVAFIKKHKTDFIDGI